MRARAGIRACGAVLAACFALLVAAPAQGALTLAPAFSGSVPSPIYVTAPPGDAHRLFVVSRSGAIYVAVDGVLQATPFLDISSRVTTTGEGGLLSMAVAPDYATSGKFYVYFIQKSDGHIRVEQFTRSGANPNVADSSGTQMLDVAHPTFTNHYGGQIAFGPDGLLYVGTGDGGDAGDPNGNAQNASSQLGKLLAIETSNGTVTTAALGLRNPFRFSFDRTSGDLMIGDVGQDQWEEVDWVPATDTLTGSNFGWNCWEANNHRVPACDPTSYVPPVLAYANPNGPASPPAAVTGGVVVRDSSLPSLFGRYLYADFYAGQVHSVQLAKPVTDDRVESALPTVSQLVAFGEDAEAHVYVVSLAGSVRRIVETSNDGSGQVPASNDPPPIAQPSDPQAPTDQSSPAIPGPAPPTARDVTPPRLRIRAAHTQDALRRGAVRLAIACDEPCAVRAAGRARGIALRGVFKRISADRRVVFELRASARALRAIARRGVVIVTLRGRDAVGNLRTASLTVNVKR